MIKADPSILREPCVVDEYPAIRATPHSFRIANVNEADHLTLSPMQINADNHRSVE